MSKEKSLNKDIGLFLLVENDNKQVNYVFYRAYYTKDELMHAVNTDDDLRKMVETLKPLDLVIINLEVETTQDTKRQQIEED